MSRWQTYSSLPPFLAPSHVNQTIKLSRMNVLFTFISFFLSFQFSNAMAAQLTSVQLGGRQIKAYYETNILVEEI